MQGEFVTFSWTGIPYAFTVRKYKTYTRLGGQWGLFVDDHDLKAGDRVMLEYVSQSKCWRCLPFDKNEKERSHAVPRGKLIVLGSVFIEITSGLCFIILSSHLYYQKLFKEGRLPIVTLTILGNYHPLKVCWSGDLMK